MDNHTNTTRIPPLSYEDGKLSHDRYEIYVNDDFVGNKFVLGQNEDIHDLEKYLKTQGYEDFSLEVKGDHVEITVNQSTEQLKEMLTSYLSIR